MKYTIIAAILIFLSACSATVSEQSIRDQISEKKKAINALNQEIGELEKQLGTMNSSEKSGEKVAVVTRMLSWQPFRHYIEVGGTAEAVREAYISPEVSGQIREIYVNEGDYVNKGQLLAKLNTEITESSIADLQASLDLATTVYEKQARLWEKGIGSELQYLNAKNGKESLEQKLKALQAQLEMAMIKSPVNGYVDRISQKKGEIAMPGMQMMLVVNLDELFINADVAESYLADVREGDPVKLEFPVYPELEMEVPVYRKGNVINPNNRTFEIQVKIQNSEKKLKPNMLSIIHINDFFADSALVVPSALIKQDISGSYLYVLQQSDNRSLAKKVYVKPGKSYLDQTMVLEGLGSGQMIITEGYNMVSDGTEVLAKPGDAS